MCSEKITVLFLIDTLETGGAEKSLVAIASHFKEVIPVFVQVYPGSGLKEKLLENNIEVHNLNIKEGYNFRQALKILIPLVHQIKPDIVHTTLFKSDIIGRKLKRIYNVLLLNSLVNNSYLKQRYKNLDLVSQVKLFLVQEYDKYTSKSVDLFISNSKAIKETNAKALGISEGKIKVIHRGRDLKDFTDIEQSSLKNLKNELHLHNKTVFLNVSRLLERKGQLDLLKSFKTIIRNDPQSILIIAGEGGYRTVLEDYILKNKLDKNIKLLGNRNDIPELLSVADFFVFPSWYEGLPGALIEAMMSNTPIIASNIQENLECIDENCAEIFEKGNVDSLIQSLGNAVSNKEMMIVKAEKAKDIAIEKFSIRNISKEYENTYKTLILKK